MKITMEKPKIMTPKKIQSESSTWDVLINKLIRPPRHNYRETIMGNYGSMKVRKKLKLMAYFIIEKKN